MTSNAAITEYNPIELGLDILREKYLGVTYDCATSDGMKTAKSARRDVAKYRTELEKTRKQIKAPALERCKAIDTEAKRITAELLTLEQPIAMQIKMEEDRIEAETQRRIEAEQERIARAERQIEAIAAPIMQLLTASADEIQAQIQRTANLELPDGEFSEKAESARRDVLDKLQAMHTAARDREHIAAGLEVERKQLALDRAAIETARRETEIAQQELDRARNQDQIEIDAVDPQPSIVASDATCEPTDDARLEGAALWLEDFVSTYRTIESLTPVFNAARLWIGEYRASKAEQ